MNALYFTQRKMKETAENYHKSKFLGSPVFPEHFLDGKELDENSFFLMQVNLEDLKGRQEYLPKSGFLYFFLDPDTFVPTVLFTEEEPLIVIEDINEIFEGEYGDTAAYELVFDSDIEEGHYLLGDVNSDLGLEGDTDLEGKVTLLEIDALALPDDANLLDFNSLANGIGHYVFLIREDDLRKRDFSRVELIDCGN